MATYDALPPEVRKAYREANHDWSSVDTYYSFDADETTVNEETLTVFNSDKKQAILYEWGIANGFPPHWEERAARAIQQQMMMRRSKGTRINRDVF